MSKNKKSRRVTSANANRRLPGSLSPLTLPGQMEFDFPKPTKSFWDLRPYEDRREWHPEGSWAPARSFSSTRHRLTVVDQPRARSTPLNRNPWRSLRNYFSQTKARVAFSNPSRVLVCVRRSIRREVLHALRKSGRRGQKPPRRTWYSSVSCRR